MRITARTGVGRRGARKPRADSWPVCLITRICSPENRDYKVPTRWSDRVFGQYARRARPHGNQREILALHREPGQLEVRCAVL